jgi:hypothetical protein
MLFGEGVDVMLYTGFVYLFPTTVFSPAFLAPPTSHQPHLLKGGKPDCEQEAKETIP